MRAKYIVIILLLALVTLVVGQMIRIEKKIRSRNTITLRVADESAPLIEKASPRELRQFARNSRFISRCSGNHIEFLRPAIQNGEFREHWTPFFLKGVNLGVAIPGDFPASFSASRDTFCRWFREIGEMNANVIRIYTILPPAFYDAFAEYNLLHADKPIYLYHGVWAEDPPGGNFMNPDFQAEFKKEIRNMIDIIHGRATLPERRGHASGVYTADISAYVGGIILGREWEPTYTHITNTKIPIGNYEGDFVSAYHATATEVFLATMMDFAVLYETQVYQWQRPVSFINWLTLDPLYHNSEFMLSDPKEHFDEDLEGIDIRKFHASDLFAPGIFSSYHVYPYYPDFIYLGEDYRKKEGEHYRSYLRELKSVHRDIPLLIAEYGLPNSRANSHWAPSGFDQGGHSEVEQAERCGTMTRDIYETGCAGAVIFEWIDEWFKHNWLVYDYEVPGERRPLWHNMENAEQNFGIVAFRGDDRSIDGRLEDWPKAEDLMTHQDYACFYIGAKLPQLDFNRHDLYISFDTHDEDRGEMLLPFGNQSAKGIEFLARFRSRDDAEVMVDDEYGGFTDIISNIRPSYSSKANRNGRFLPQTLLANRQQVSLTGDTTFAWIYNRGRLRHGISSDPASSNADWFWNPNGRVFELRLPWLMLNIADPSSLQVHDDRKGTKACETSTTDGIRIQMFVTDKQGKVLSKLPASGPKLSTWQGWNSVQCREHRKVLYDTLQSLFNSMVLYPYRDSAYVSGKPRLARYYNDAPGALSVGLGSNLGWYPELAEKVFSKFHYRAALALHPPLLSDGSGDLSDLSGYRAKRMEPEQLIRLAQKGFELGIQEPATASDLLMLDSLLGQPVALVYSGKIPGLKLLPYQYSLNLSSKDVIRIGPAGISNAREFIAALQARLGRTSHLWFERVDPPDTWTEEAWSTVNFERMLRLARNAGFWVETPGNIRAYELSRDAVRLEMDVRGRVSFLRIVLQKSLAQPVPLTVVIPSNASRIRVSNSLSDGVHQVREGRIMIDVMPGAQITLENIE